MRRIIISDSHNRWWKVDAALEAAEYNDGVAGVKRKTFTQIAKLIREEFDLGEKS